MTASNLAILKINLDSLRLLVPSSQEQVLSRVAQCVQLSEEAIREVRTISYLLYPPMLEELGLKSAIPWYLEGFTKRSNIQTTLEIASSFGRLSRELELALFRVLQESLTNVHRHSESPVAHVRLFEEEVGMVVLEIEDEGKGLVHIVLEQGAEELPAEFGVGLRGMNERMRQLGGKLKVKATEHGVLVRAVVPAKTTAPLTEEVVYVSKTQTDEAEVT